MTNVSERAEGQREIGLNIPSAFSSESKEVEKVNLITERKGEGISKVTILYSGARPMYLRRNPHNNH